MTSLELLRNYCETWNLEFVKLEKAKSFAFMSDWEEAVCLADYKDSTRDAAIFLVVDRINGEETFHVVRPWVNGRMFAKKDFYEVFSVAEFRRAFEMKRQVHMFDTR